MRKILKNNRGITLTTLVIAVIMMSIITSILVYNTTDGIEIKKYNNMCNDIQLLNDKILSYYNKYGEVPKTSRKYNIDGIDYFEIDLSKLDNLTLYYGKEYKEAGQLTESSDVYLVNDSLNIYYLKGVEKSGEKHHKN